MGYRHPNACLLRIHPKCTETIRLPMAGDVTLAKIVVKAIFGEIGWGRGLSIFERVGMPANRRPPKCQNVLAFVLTTFLAVVQCRYSARNYGGGALGAAAIGPTQNASYFADRVFQSDAAVFVTALCRIDGKSPVDVRRCCYSKRCRRRAFGGNVWRPPIPVPSEYFTRFSQHTKETEWHRDATRFLL